jgi:hypothetical protein
LASHALRLVADEQFAPESATGLLFEIHVGKGYTKQLSSSWTDQSGGK